MNRFLILFLLLLLLAACGPAADSTGPATIPSLVEPAGTPVMADSPLPTLDPAAITLGKTVYATHCAACHGADLEGEAEWKLPNDDGTFRAPPHDASGHTWHHSDKQLLEAVRLGGERLPSSLGATSLMPAFDEILNEAEMTAVLTFIKSTWPDDIRQMQWEVSQRDPIGEAP